MLNKKGFIFVETITAVTILVVIMIMIYGSFVMIVNNEKTKEKYDQTPYLYTTSIFRDYLETNNINSFIYSLEDSENSLFKLECSDNTLFNNKTTCNNIYNIYNINKAYIVNNTLSNVIETDDLKLKEYLKYKDKDTDLYRLVIKFNDGNISSLLLRVVAESDYYNESLKDDSLSCIEQIKGNESIKEYKTSNNETIKYIRNDSNYEDLISSEDNLSTKILNGIEYTINCSNIPSLTKVASDTDETLVLSSYYVTNENGIYQRVSDYDNDIFTYFFRGVEEKNYIKLNNELWKIVSVESDGKIKIVKYNPLSIQYSFPFSKLKNGTFTFDSKLNNNKSINDILDEYYNSLNYINAISEGYFCIDNFKQSSELNYENGTDYNIPKDLTTYVYNSTNKVYDSKFNCTNTSRNIGLLNAYEMVNSGSTIKEDISLFNFLNPEARVSTLTVFDNTKLSFITYTLGSKKSTNSNNTDKGYSFYDISTDATANNRGIVSTDFAYSYTINLSGDKNFLIRPSLYLKENIKVISGNGTYSDPYLLEYDGVSL